MPPERPVDPRRPQQLSYRLRDALIAVVLPAIVGTARLCPKPLFGGVVAFLAWVHRVGSRREMRIARDNFRHVLGVPEERIEPMVRQLCREQIAIQLESVRGILSPGSLEIEGDEELRDLLTRVTAAGRGSLLVTGHLGSWELVLHWVAKTSPRPFHFLAKRTRMAPLTRFVDRLRSRSGARSLWVGDKSLVRDMLRAVKGGGILGFAMDQKPKRNRGPAVRFFGLPTAFVGGPGAIGLRTQCPVVSVYCLRVAPFRYRLVGREVLPADHGIDDERSLTQVFADDIEAEIRRYPTQWMWTYRRWRFDATGAVVDAPDGADSSEQEDAA